MWRVTAMAGLAVGAALGLAGCSTVQLDTSTDCTAAGGVRGGVVSYRFSREQAAAHRLMAEYCSPRGYHVVGFEKGPAGASCPDVVNKEETFAVRRTYVRFDCEKE